LLLFAIRPGLAETAASEKSMHGEKAEKAERARKTPKRESAKEPEKAESKAAPEGSHEKAIEENGSTQHQSSCYSHPWLCR
jgi:hypothetical protein